jgi:hypothetical protein
MTAPDGNRAGSWIERTRTGLLSLWLLGHLPMLGGRHLCPRDFNIPCGVAYFLPRELVEVEVHCAIRIELSGLIVVLDHAIILSLVSVCDATVIERESAVRIELDRLIEVLDARSYSRVSTQATPRLLNVLASFSVVVCCPDPMIVVQATIVISGVAFVHLSPFLPRLWAFAVPANKTAASEIMLVSQGMRASPAYLQGRSTAGPSPSHLTDSQSEALRLF